MKITGIKRSLDQLLARIEQECTASSEAEIRQELAMRSRGASVCEMIAQYNRALKHLQSLKAALKKAGIEVYNDAEPCLSNEVKEAIRMKWRVLTMRFQAHRNSLIVRSVVADEDEKRFLVENFFREVEVAFPALKSLVQRNAGK